MIDRDDDSAPFPGFALSTPTLVATRAYPPIPGGSAVIMQNLLNGVAADSIVLATSKPLATRDGELVGSHVRHFVSTETELPGVIERIRRFLIRPVLTRRLVRIGRRFGCGSVVGVYPDLLFLDASERAARILGVPFFPYLHDTVVEAASSSRFAGWARRVQERTFRSAVRVFVATKGMQSLYKRKYALNSVALVHIYPETVPKEPPALAPPKKSLLWAGATYSINSTSLLRVYRAMNRVGGLRLTMATAQKPRELEFFGFNSKGIDRTYIPVDERPRYLQLIRDHSVLVLALNWPDETHIHEDELATIFPTKTPEYLASGRPILVHCPEHYCLARFFMENGCGEVVTTRSEEVVEAALHRILDSEAHQRELGLAGINAVKQFSQDLVIGVFVEEIESALSEENQ